jgi:hypothetical protein
MRIDFDELHQKKLAETNREWTKGNSNPFIKRLNAGINFQDIALELVGVKALREAFSKPLTTIACGDGRVKVREGERKIGIAGQLILVNDKDDFINRYRGKGWIRFVTSHDDCGAGKDYCITKGLDSTDSDDLCTEHAMGLARSLEAEYYHIPVAGIHQERMIVFDATGRFCPALISDFPEHFLISGYGYGLSLNSSVYEACLYSLLAFKNHGFKERFTEETPLFILLTVFNQRQSNLLYKYLNSIRVSYKSRVRLETLIVPKLIQS